MVRSILLALALTSVSQAGTLAPLGERESAFYEGINATDGLFEYEMVLIFDDSHEEMTLALATNSPSGSITRETSWIGMDARGARYYSDEDHLLQVALIGGDFVETQLTSETFPELVDGIELNWYDPQFDSAGMFQTWLHVPQGPKPEVRPVLEPSAWPLLLIGCLLTARILRRPIGR